MKKCIFCEETKPMPCFSRSKSSDGFQSACKPCQKLRDHALVVAADRDGFSSREKWVRTIARKDRAWKHVMTHQELFQEKFGRSLPLEFYVRSPFYSNILKQQEEVSRNSRLKEMDSLLAEVRSRHKAELAQLNNSQSKIKEGFVYIITNPAWPNMVKVGSAVDYEDRLNTYQTYDPHRKYKLEYVKYFGNRKKAEKTLLDLLIDKKVGGEWIELDVSTAISMLNSVRFISSRKRE